MKEGEKLNKRISFDKETSWEQENGIKQVNFNNTCICNWYNSYCSIIQLTSSTWREL